MELIIIKRTIKNIMADYKKLCRQLIEDHISDVQQWQEQDKGIGVDVLSRRQILEELLEDTQNVFGNIDGSRTFSTWEAQEFINKSGAIWDDEILELFEAISDDYFFETLKRGAETLDVVILELLSNQVINEMLDEEEA